MSSAAQQERGAVRGMGSPVTERSALELTLRALRPLLSDPEVNELCINRPGEAFLETRAGWRREVLPFADFEWCHRLAKLVANSTKQRVDEESPLLSASLPSGERIQIVLPPATTQECVAISIRRPSDEVWTIDELSARGIFQATKSAEAALDPTDAPSLLPEQPCQLNQSSREFAFSSVFDFTIEVKP
jgi:type IV secretion system protein VirB11